MSRFKSRTLYYKKQHKEKMRRLFLKEDIDSPILSFSDWIKCKEYFNNQCAYCGKKAFLIQEHFYPASKGGAYSINNIIPACWQCNRSKYITIGLIWYPKQKFFSIKRLNKILKYLNI